MKIPTWVQIMLDEFEATEEPFNEVAICDALRGARNDQGDLSEDDFKGFYAEWGAFLFHERPDKDSVWGTYFAPMMTATRQGGSEFRSPDIREMDADAVARWEHRARTVQHPVMRARYGDLVWDLKQAISNEKPSYEYAQLAIDAYLEAATRRLYSLAIVGVHWLQRALSLARSLGDNKRTQQVVTAIFALYDAEAQPHLAGIWIFPFDALYGEKGLLTPEQETRIIADLETMLGKTTTPGSDFDPFGAQAAAERLAQHYRRQNDPRNVKRVITAYGGAFESISTQANGLLATAWLQPVMERYEQEGWKQEAERIQLLAAEKARSIPSELKEVAVEIKIDANDLDRLIEHLIGADLQTALHRTAVYFVPSAENARTIVDRMRTQAPLLSMIRATKVDASGQPIASIGPVDEDAEGHLHEQLGRAIMFDQLFLVETINRVRRQYNPSVEDLSAFLAQSPLFPPNAQQLLREGLSAYERGDFVKTIHVLVPQVEHTLRAFLGLIGIPMMKTVKRHPGVMDAKGMNDILSDERVQKILTENLWRYLTVLYVDRKGGLNLRNDLAHGLANPAIFSRAIADRVVHSLLALSLIRATGERE